MASTKYVRRPAVAGQFYPGDKEELVKQLSGLIQLSPFGFVVQGVVVPHAGYIYSGRLAGSVYGKVHIPDHVILLGPNHTGRGVKASIMEGGEWEIPLGTVPIETELAKTLLASASLLESDWEAHRNEHCLEVQIPFLFHLNPNVRVAPITLMHLTLDECLKLGSEIAQVVQGWRVPVLLVASTDMTHYESRSSAQQKDRLAIEQMVAMSPEGLYQTVEKNRISMCGYIPTTVVLAACKTLGVQRGEFVGYSDSGDTTRDTERVVGYAGLILRG